MVQNTLCAVGCQEGTFKKPAFEFNVKYVFIVLPAGGLMATEEKKAKLEIACEGDECGITICGLPEKIVQSEDKIHKLLDLLAWIST